MRYEPAGNAAVAEEALGFVVVECWGEVLIASRFVTGSAVNRVPSSVAEHGGEVEIRTRAPIAPLKATSRETVFGTGCAGALLGSATGVLFPTFWRFISDAILMQE